MKAIISLLALGILTLSKAHAASKYFGGYYFEANVISSARSHESSDSHLLVCEGDEYSIVVYNPLPIRVAAAVTVDGLNTIDGRRSNPSDAQKWIIDPYSSITIRGWQTGDSRSRRFIFTRPNASYAQWKQSRDGKRYTQNLGVIGIAYFWDSRELERSLPPRRSFLSEDDNFSSDLRSAPSAEMSEKSRSLEGRAGTGMGRNEWNPVNRVNFYYDSGMYSASDALSIYYEFDAPQPQPLPFEEPYRYRGNYAPEMPY